MTKFFFNKEDFSSHVTSKMDMEAVFQKLNDLQKDRDVLISSILIDGKEIDLEKTDPTTLKAEELQKAQKVEIFEASENLVMLSAFTEMSSYLNKIPSILPDLIKDLRTKVEKETFENLADFLESIRFMIMLFNTFYKKHPNYEKIDIQIFTDKVNELLDIFQEIVVAQEEKDAVLLADLIEYDLVKSLDYFRDAIPVMKEFLIDEVKKEDNKNNADASK